MVGLECVRVGVCRHIAGTAGISVFPPSSSDDWISDGRTLRELTLFEGFAYVWVGLG